MADAATHDEMACRELVELVTDYFEGALLPDQRQRFAAHLAACPPCREYLDQIRRTVHAVGQIGAAPVAAEERARLLALFQRWCEQAAG